MCTPHVLKVSSSPTAAINNICTGSTSTWASIGTGTPELGLAEQVRTAVRLRSLTRTYHTWYNREVTSNIPGTPEYIIEIVRNVKMHQVLILLIQYSKYSSVSSGAPLRMPQPSRARFSRALGHRGATPTSLVVLSTIDRHRFRLLLLLLRDDGPLAPEDSHATTWSRRARRVSPRSVGVVARRTRSFSSARGVRRAHCHHRRRGHRDCHAALRSPDGGRRRRFPGREAAVRRRSSASFSSRSSTRSCSRSGLASLTSSFVAHNQAGRHNYIRGRGAAVHPSARRKH